MKNTRKKSSGLKLIKDLDSDRTNNVITTVQTFRTESSTLRRKRSVESIDVKRKPILKVQKSKCEPDCSKVEVWQNSLLEQTRALADLLTQNKQQLKSQCRVELGPIESTETNRHQLRASSAPKMSHKIRSQTEYVDREKENDSPKMGKKKSIRLDINLGDIIMEHVKKVPDTNKEIETIFVKGLKKKLDDIEKQSRKMVTYPTPTFRNLVVVGTLQTLKNKLGTQRFNTQNTTCESLNSSSLFR